ncbi:MAG: class I SAM-dependent methyltransferase [Bryobacteraceae bacterium]|nr:class I SAM-dependent methyltransferase [Bryobacteraceae bacterium]
MQGYREDLAFIHDDGFIDFANRSAPGILALLRRNGVRSGLVVDLGCGSGRWAARLLTEGYDVAGIDLSPAMIALARRHAPRAEFRRGSLLSARLPACDAITSLGECINFAFHPRDRPEGLRRFFDRVFQSLRPGGVFVLDFATPDRIPTHVTRNWFEGAGWALHVEVSGDRKARVLRRRIVSFRKAGSGYRRSEETHRLNLYTVPEVEKMLRSAGFQPERLSGYGRFRLYPGMSALLARKP